MNLNLREAARALELTEGDVIRLVREGSLPACHVDDTYLFNPVELQEWAEQHHHKLGLGLVRTGPGPRETLRLADAVERGGIHYDLEGTNRSDILDEVARLPTIPPHVDRALLAEVLRNREGLASTGIGKGIAIPHPRDPLILHVERPIILLCLLRQSVDFGAIDGVAVNVVFTLLSPTTTLHLKVLSRLAYALHDEPIIELLRQRATSELILQRLRELDAAIDQSGGTR